MKRLFAFTIFLLVAISSQAQHPVHAATAFIATLNAAQKSKALYPFDTAERYNFHFVPKDDRKGITWNELTPPQQNAARALVKTCLSEQGAKKAFAIMQLDGVLKILEHRSADDHFRDTGKYYFTIFGVPGANTIWGWRLEGHHISFTFSADKDQLVSGTPGFMGANPAIVPEGPKKGTEVLKEETDDAFALLHALSATQLQKALIDTTAPGEIFTFANRQAMIEHPAGITYAEMNAAQQQQLLQLIGVYVHRYTKLFADAMFKEMQEAGLENVRFGWAGAREHHIGQPHYYRIQGPTFIIEYDNTQNNANHVHSVLRDLKNDFGGDLLLEHYRTSHKGA